MRRAKESSGGYTYRGIGATEDDEQETVFEWAALMSGRWPELGMMVHIPNEGKRSVSYGARLKRMGMRRGFPDMMLPVARGGSHGLFIELKTANGKPSEDQLRWLDRLNEQGYKAIIAYGAGEAIEAIRSYLEEQ